MIGLPPTFSAGGNQAGPSFSIRSLPIAFSGVLLLVSPLPLWLTRLPSLLPLLSSRGFPGFPQTGPVLKKSAA